MAQEGFAGYQTGVPTTTGMGQGAAQVYAPQAIGIDTSSFENAMYNIAGAYERKKQREREVDLKRQAKLDEVNAGIYNINNEAKNELVDQAIQKSIEDGTDPMQAINAALYQAEAIDKTETEIIKPLISKLSEENTLLYDDEGKYVPPAQAQEFLTQSLKDSPEAQEAIKNGTYNQWLQNKALELDERSIKYDPNFSLGGEMLTEFQKYSQGAKSSDISAAVSDLNAGYDLKTVFSKYPDVREEFTTQHLPSRTDIAKKWAANYVVNQGLSPYMYKAADKEFMGLAMDAMLDEAGSVALPKPQTTAQMSVAQKADGGAGAKALEAALSPPAAFVLNKGKDNETPVLATNINVNEDVPLTVQTDKGQQEVLGRPRRVEYDEKSGKYYLEYYPYERVEKGQEISAGGKSLITVNMGGEKFALNKEKVERVEMKEDDVNFNALTSAIETATKAESGSAKQRLLDMQKYTLTETGEDVSPTAVKGGATTPLRGEQYGKPVNYTVKEKETVEFDPTQF